MIHIVAYQPEIALNLGNILRTAACFGLKVDVVEPCGFPFSIKALKRSAMDYADHVEIERFDDWESYKKQSQARRVLLTTKSAHPYTDFAFQPGDALILGRESAGVPKEVFEDCDSHVTIPMQNDMRSLNVSTSAAIVAAEALRQLGQFRIK